MSTRRYCLITPCRDEAALARRTLDSVAAQTLLPALWILVDDGSSDDTPRILAEYAARYPWMRTLRRPDRGDRKLGGGVIDAFYAGYETIDPREFEYVCKLDLDLELPPRYFELLVRHMESDPRLGTCSGKAYFPAAGAASARPRFPLADLAGFVSERVSDDHSLGMAKFYRSACFLEIGGFARQLMWDGIDSHRCRQLGWIAASWDEPELRFVHLRPMGTSHKSWWSGRVRHGVGQYSMGTSCVWMLASATFRMTRPPLLVGGIAMLWGYFASMLRRETRYGDEEFRRFVRRFQWACLLKGRTRAVRELDARQAPVWERRRAHGARAGSAV
jgi:glycosyltransferase involved in cell wall biosynthesis